MDFGDLNDFNDLKGLNDLSDGQRTTDKYAVSG
jgi:hypothetical protein